MPPEFDSFWLRRRIGMWSREMNVPFEVAVEAPTELILQDLKFIEYVNKTTAQKQQSEADKK